MSSRLRLFFLLVIAWLLVRTTAYANVVGTDIQNFNPTSNGIDFVTVQSSETLEPGILSVGLFGNYARNTLPYFEDPPGTGYHYDDYLAMADLNIGIGVTRNLDFGLNFPFLVSQGNEARTANIEYIGSGNTEIRGNFKWRLWGDATGGAAVVGTMSHNRVVDSPFTGRNGGPVYSLEAVGDTSYRRVAMGINIGYRSRSPGDRISQYPIKPFRDQVVGSAAASYLIPGWPVKLILEIYGAQPARFLGDDSDKLHSVSEWLGGFKVDMTSDWALHFGGGARIAAETASPDWRVYTGLNWAATILNEEATKEDVAEAKSSGAPQPITPALADLAPIPGESTFTAPEVLFKFNVDTPDTKSVKDLLGPLVTHLLKNPVFKSLTVKGHTDSVGSVDYNNKLSLRRSVNVKKALLEVFKLDESKISAVGYGETLPVADNGNYQGRRKNRRVEFTIYR